MRIIRSAIALGCDVCEVHITGEAGSFYCSSRAYGEAYDAKPISFQDAGPEPVLVLRSGSVDFDTLPPPNLPAGPLWAIIYAPGQGLSDEHIHQIAAAPDAAGALKVWASVPGRGVDDAEGQLGRYVSVTGQVIQLAAVPWAMPQFCELCGLKMRSAEHGTGRCEYHAVEVAV